MIPDKLPNGRPFFRKAYGEKPSYNELYICSLIKINNPPNIVEVYNVTPDHIDMELLDMEIFPKDEDSFYDDVNKGLDELHKLGVVYIDLKKDNIGYSHTSKCWKIFDFDASGVLNQYEPNKWLLEPPNYFVYKNHKSKIKNLMDFDSLPWSHLSI